MLALSRVEWRLLQEHGQSARRRYADERGLCRRTGRFRHGPQSCGGVSLASVTRRPLPPYVTPPRHRCDPIDCSKDGHGGVKREATPEETALYVEVLSKLDEGVAVLGWGDPEHAYTNITSANGGIVLCTFSAAYKGWSRSWDLWVRVTAAPSSPLTVPGASASRAIRPRLATPPAESSLAAEPCTPVRVPAVPPFQPSHCLGLGLNRFSRHPLSAASVAVSAISAAACSQGEGEPLAPWREEGHALECTHLLAPQEHLGGPDGVQLLVLVKFERERRLERRVSRQQRAHPAALPAEPLGHREGDGQRGSLSASGVAPEAAAAAGAAAAAAAAGTRSLLSLCPTA